MYKREDTLCNGLHKWSIKNNNGEIVYKINLCILIIYFNGDWRLFAIIKTQ